MEDEYAQEGSTFEGFILTKWAELFNLSEKFRENFMANHKEPERNREFFSKLSRLWGALKPKVEGRDDMKDLVTKFMEFEKYYFNPNLFQDEDNWEDIFRMESTLELVLDKLFVTKFR